jgi:hypothetical protein
MEGIASIIMGAMHSKLALDFELEDRNRTEVFNFLLDSRYFDGRMGSGGIQPSP